MTYDGKQPGFWDFFEAYVTCAFWSTYADDEAGRGEFLDTSFTPMDLAPEALQQMQEDCSKFLEENSGDIGLDFTRQGHDFWLTRNGHGCGFWDGGWEKEAGKRLTASSKRFGEVDLYVGDDGKIYQG